MSQYEDKFHVLVMNSLIFTLVFFRCKYLLYGRDIVWQFVQEDVSGMFVVLKDIIEICSRDRQEELHLLVLTYNQSKSIRILIQNLKIK